MTPEEEIKQLGIERGAEQVGIASVEDINRYAPAGHRPDDHLIGAKSVIVFNGHVSLRGAWHGPGHQTHYANRSFARIRDGVAMAAAQFIESEYGHYSLAIVPFSSGFNPGLSQKLCAEMAGLGTRSLAASILLNHEVGMLSISTCITTMPLEADGPMKEPVCPHPSCVKLWEKQETTPCLEVCPDCLSGELEGGRIKWMRYDRRICTTRAQTHSTGSLLRTLVEGVKEPDEDARRSILLGSFYRSVTGATSAGQTMGQCGECLRNCPVCIKARSLKPKNAQPETQTV